MELIDFLKRKNNSALKNILKSLQMNLSHPVWVHCPTCKQEWNKLTESGVCPECEIKCHDC